MYWLTVNYYSTDLIKRLIQSIEVHSGINYQLIIVNNSPNDSSIYQLKSPSVIILDASENLGFGLACNLGLNWVYQQDDQAIVWLINPDAILSENSAIQGIQFFEQYPELSVLGTVVYNVNQELEFTGGEFNSKTGVIRGSNILSKDIQNQPYCLTQWVSGCSLLINFKKFKECPQFDPNYFLYYEDFDFCLRYQQQGHKIGITSQFYVIHNTSSITSRNQGQKIQHSIYSYLLTLKKYTSKSIFLYWLFRINLVAILTLIITPKKSVYKLKGVIMILSARD